MNTLYLVCSHSCLSQMEVPYLLNNSPNLHGTSQAGEHWATYELDGKSIDHEPGILGKIRVHDDYWNIEGADSQYYNHEVRNTMKITIPQLDGLLNLIKNKSIAVLLHAQNYHEIWKWSRGIPVIMIRTAIDEWDGNIVHWAAREYNTLMLDSNNNNNSTENHSWPGVNEVVDAFVNKKAYNNLIDDCEGDIILKQSQWTTLEGLDTLWKTVGIDAPDQNWINQYYEDFQNHQEIDQKVATELIIEYNRRSQ